MDFLENELSKSYWKSLEIEQSDIEFLYSFLLENETPLPSNKLAEALIQERSRLEKEKLEQKQQKNGEIFRPEMVFSIGEKIQFPALNWLSGNVTNLREGKNPEHPDLQVITVLMENGQTRQFANNLKDHVLNQTMAKTEDMDEDDFQDIYTRFGAEIAERLEAKLKNNKDIVRIGEDWFPKSLLVDFNEGHLNLAEAVLDMHSGGPIGTDTLLEQIDFETDDPDELVQFSLNYALQEDQRFDEVGTSGIFQWFLNRLEPEYVREKPLQLAYQPVDYDRAILTEDMLKAEQQIDDEFVEPNPEFSRKPPTKEISIVLNYPHWRTGSIPLTHFTQRFFPTALESPRVKFTLIDPQGYEISAWVVRPYSYIYGLKEWYEERELMPGSIINIKHGKNPGEVLIQPQKKKSNREWIRTLLIGADGGVVFAMLKQTITADFNERLAVAVPSTEILDELWQKRANNPLPLNNVILSVMKELAKLNPQGHVHAVELYAALNCIRRCPPGLVFSMLASQPEYVAVGDLYYRLSNNK